jgi:CubicO group peptidase (beta-lactamase class C family)
MKGRGSGRFAGAVLCLALAACASAAKKPDFLARGDYSFTREYVSWRIRNEMGRHDVTGLSIALVDDQRVVWAEGFGYADRANGVPAAPGTVYRVGSISKRFTATAAMQLAEEGKIDIDRPLEACLPGFSIRSRFQDAGPVTPRRRPVGSSVQAIGDFRDKPRRP